MGKQIETYSQQQFSNLFGIGNVDSGGVCAAMCAKYLSMRSRGEDYWKWQKSVKGRTEVINIHGSGKTADEYMSEVYKILDEMTRVGSVDKVPMGSLNDYLQATKKQLQNKGDGDYIWFSLYVGPTLFSAGGGHALALQRSPKIRFMDPNYGEWEFTSMNEFLSWFNKTHVGTHYRWAYNANAELQYMDA